MSDRFVVGLEAFAHKVKLRRDLLMRRVLLELFRDLQRASPVDTGMFRANWQIGITSRPSGAVNTKSRGEAMQAAMSAVNGIAPHHTTFFITNNLPYAMALEYGVGENPYGRGSRQAPEGVARITVEGWVDRVNRAMNETKRGNS